ncbi:bifunctional [glutamine synthetase] adenylyltransferase/[glutamine synthetase]-adenylyl-L-tyrosine phosphorylase [Frankia sp. CNm7]|uniref:Bifunctional glutamine synthetase adenylyltransferase/adenylyl-removing enzyme n=1 Tax=Frankia nepalensis TaxID=1836974 RepID=A0A937REE4_9ACTN|nr:bifunctional [glutamine synthetase] adenylyltransferase/[glutamine synthetase]-adenylyl-L-tyrosine phosphorylase [Frankia nepalensis]MBL7497879.1 bifunctional [glutamine synthetase] adenylyltransferase/[glutamine synthetase]-adenylyl-L-tyrosine phosphorylase [Frankia nepalensis]MBL7515710.1 bifunctional [glutamine synthetase] adenylyltransferase/[glutamine synthetase]-adenylyl-L-tyrosine phosphorylase [Frankia nepalensis]MBL7524920.1 bifunctional [glutamine synthetase] adenylyltransferase/[gl
MTGRPGSWRAEHAVGDLAPAARSPAGTRGPAAGGAGHPRGSSAAAQLARLGFTDVDRVAATLRRLNLHPPQTSPIGGADRGGTPGAPLADDPMIAELARAADPDRALAGLDRLVDALDASVGPAGPARGSGSSQLWTVLAERPGARRRLAAVLGASLALADHLAAHPADWRILADDEVIATAPDGATHRARLLAAVGADPAHPRPRARDDGPEVLDALRVAYRRALLVLAARDLTDTVTIEDATAELADLAAAALDAALAIARAGLAPSAPPVRLAVVGMGKCGGRELNYVSDVDVVFVAEPAAHHEEATGTEAGEAGQSGEEGALRAATRLAEGIVRACGATTPEGSLFQVDVGLRPEGRDGALVRTLASHRAYYRRWARTWEFQALLKARPIAGDLELGADFCAMVEPLVWSAASRPGFVADIRAMRRRVEASVPGRDADRNIKLGPGGLRDVEFAVQLLQLVHGRTDTKLHARATLTAIDGLARGGYVGRRDATSLADAYRFLRAVEHRLQLRRLRRVHVLPRDPDELRWLGRSLGLLGADELTAEHAGTARSVRQLHEKLFYQPLLEAVARLSAEEVRLTQGEAADRLAALGFAYPHRSLKHIEALTAGVSRTAVMQRHLLPTMLPAFADAADPDAGLLAYRQVSEALGRAPWYLRMLRDSAGAADRLARVLAASGHVAALMRAAPESVRLLRTEDDLRPVGRDELARTLLAVARRNADPDDAAARARAIRRVELVRVACADLLGLLDVTAVGESLTGAAAATIEASLLVARRTVTRRVAAGHRATDRFAATGPEAAGTDWAELTDEPARIAVIAMGRLGGGEMSYGSDADVMFVHEPAAGTDPATAGEYAAAVVEELVRLLGQPGLDPALRLDLGLRPEGRNGPVTRDLDGYAAYYRRWALGWEAQALLRARPLAGDAELAARFRELADDVRYPATLPAGAIAEIERLRDRMAVERVARRIDRSLHVKFGPGGLTDVEWAVQILQLRHAREIPALRTTGTLTALRELVTAGLVDGAEAATLNAAWLSASRIRNAVMLARGTPGDLIPRTTPALDRVAGVLGYPPDQVEALPDDHRRAATAARRVVDAIFAREQA